MSNLSNIEECSVCNELHNSNNVVECDCGTITCIDCLDKSCNFCPGCGKDLTEEIEKIE